MERTSFKNFPCPAARALESVGDWWSILILRDAFQGIARFDDFEKSLGIAPNMLTRRLKHLVEEGLFERQRYSERPPRYEYVLSPKGQDFFPVLMTLFAWGTRHMPENEIAMRIGDPATDRERKVIVVDSETGDEILPENTVLIPGPAADKIVLERIALTRRRHDELRTD